MNHNIKMTLRLHTTGLILLTINSIQLKAQNCEPAYKLAPVTVNNTIEWAKFPEFTLPFKVIYNGPRFGDTQSQPLKHGFSHLASFSGNEPGSIPVKNRANLWYGVATNAGNYPWADNTLRSPWGNDTTAYRNYWDAYASTVSADMVCLDVERFQREDRDILQLKSNPQIAQEYRNLSDAQFLSTYKRDMRWWHREAINRLRAKIGNGPLISAYSDVPVRNTWLNITSNSWQDWTTNPVRTHYLAQNDAGTVGGPYYEGMDVLAPSPYYYYGYDNPFGKDYLTYLLFHVEVNRAWSDKPVIPFVWLRVHDSYDKNTPFITPFMAEATAIFPFFSGAAGLWIWENPFFPGDRQENYSPYEHFIYGLYRLSEFKDMFEGQHELVIPTSARDLMAQGQGTVWRGVVKNNHILVAAHNAHAADNEETIVHFYHGNWHKTVTLKGKEILLCKYDLNDVITGEEALLAEVTLYPNPTKNELNIKLIGANGMSDVAFSLVNTKGQTILQKNIKSFSGMTNEFIPLPQLATGIYFARFVSKNQVITKKVIINQ
jgi:hypothetical protein